MLKNHLTRRAFAAMGCTLMLGVALAGCSSDTTAAQGSTPADSGSAEPAAESVELQIFAANSLEKAMPEVEALYTEQTGVTFADTQYKGSGDLVEQMRGGAPADILITASAGTMDDAVESELVDESTRQDMFVNDLVIVRGEGSDVQINSLEDVANVDGNIAIGEPGAVPAGKYANQSLASVGLYTNAEGEGGEYAPEIADKVSLADKVGTAAQYVSTGDCTIGFVYTSDVYRYDGIEVAYTCPDDSHKPIVYPGAVSSTSENAEAAADFLEFCMTDEDALAIWAEYGFELA
ncbi:molybdate ABC transporter substrate-binding protein [Collinsella tanakaei]|uniref:molybdate ABC transporter substrate-binding protein n=1 Tax=Collinsella ihumii TaxID=1720204 RepID=UPI00195ECC87|nr:molybdate ABC transporter substrate-binding protein [Collinsella ihumii]MBM6786399.1 molybdate ABC transporter substrate-binding protein [Collinsella tanakaei]MDN0055573.1 molybdate ABC transporter substrate-binding protein [Collinsella ihumii]